jgi:hypothetical protein
LQRYTFNDKLKIFFSKKYFTWFCKVNSCAATKQKTDLRIVNLSGINLSLLNKSRTQIL